MNPYNVISNVKAGHVQYVLSAEAVPMADLMCAYEWNERLNKELRRERNVINNSIRMYQYEIANGPEHPTHKESLRECIEKEVDISSKIDVGESVSKKILERMDKDYPELSEAFRVVCDVDRENSGEDLREFQ